MQRRYIFYKIDNKFYLSFSCKYDLDLDDFPSLNLYNKILNYSIIMDYNQLICVYRGIVYFKVVFKKKAENKNRFSEVHLYNYIR